MIRSVAREKLKVKRVSEHGGQKCRKARRGSRRYRETGNENDRRAIKRIEKNGSTTKLALLGGKVACDQGVRSEHMHKYKEN